MRVKSDMLNLLPILGSSPTITSLDITGNHMGDAGARCLASILNYNTVRLDAWRTGACER